MSPQRAFRTPSLKAMAIAVVLAALAAFLVLMAIGLLNKEPVTGRSGITRLDKPAPQFTLPLLTGGELALSEHIGQPIVINFWASWCPPCRQEAPILEQVWRDYRDRGVLFVGVEIQDTEEIGRAYLSEFDITYPNGLDSDGAVAIDYGVIGLPVTFLIDREGIVVGRVVGIVSSESLSRWVEDVLAGVAPDVDAEEDPGDFRLLEGSS